MRLVRLAVGAALLAALGGCPSTTGNTGGDDAGPLGRACNTDVDCNGLQCLGGVCGNQAGTSTSGGSGATGSSTSSSGGGSSGQPDAAQPRGAIETDPVTGPLDFGAARLGVSVVKTVLVTNIGDGPLAITNVGLRYVSGTSPARPDHPALRHSSPRWSLRRSAKI